MTADQTEEEGAVSLARRLGCRSGLVLVSTLARISRSEVRQRASLGKTAGERMLLGRSLSPTYPVVGEAVQGGALAVEQARVIVSVLDGLRPSVLVDDLDRVERSLVASGSGAITPETDGQHGQNAGRDERTGASGGQVLSPCPQEPGDFRSIGEKQAGILRAVFEAAARQPGTPTMGGAAPWVGARASTGGRELAPLPACAHSTSGTVTFFRPAIIGLTVRSAGVRDARWILGNVSSMSEPPHRWSSPSRPPSPDRSRPAVPATVLPVGPGGAARARLRYPVNDWA
ncbi:DUF222 domain-containing protein [Cryobacterium sp. TMS1-20-1]|uniref:DUF222 domain-containing protein n=1 Tax=Cryobacterium sp. TMS1-20-1 TaxID=1259223 RepID=UPI00141B92A8|nr:DUF222 domain-containing protein [Cryobacterium sp. TMS1-20-1]